MVELVLHDIPRCENKLIALCEELKDCAFPYVTSISIVKCNRIGIEYFTNPFDAFKNANVIFFLASLPLGNGDRASLLTKNITIYIEFGKAMEAGACRDCKSIVVANPANTLTYVLMQSAPSIAKEGFIALNRTDYNRARSIALRICREQCNCTQSLSYRRSLSGVNRSS